MANLLGPYLLVVPHLLDTKSGVDGEVSTIQFQYFSNDFDVPQSDMLLTWPDGWKCTFMEIDFCGLFLEARYFVIPIHFPSPSIQRLDTIKCNCKQLQSKRNYSELTKRALLK